MVKDKPSLFSLISLGHHPSGSSPVLSSLKRAGASQKLYFISKRVVLGHGKTRVLPILLSLKHGQHLFCQTLKALVLPLAPDEPTSTCKRGTDTTPWQRVIGNTGSECWRGITSVRIRPRIARKLGDGEGRKAGMRTHTLQTSTVAAQFSPGVTRLYKTIYSMQAPGTESKPQGGRTRVCESRT